MGSSDYKYGEWQLGHPKMVGGKFPKDALALVYEGLVFARSQPARTCCGLYLYEYDGSSWQLLSAGTMNPAQLEGCWILLPPLNPAQKDA